MHAPLAAAVVVSFAALGCSSDTDADGRDAADARDTADATDGADAPDDVDDTATPEDGTASSDTLDSPDVEVPDGPVSFQVVVHESRSVAADVRSAFATAGRPGMSELGAIEALRVGDCVLITPAPFPFCDPACGPGTICVTGDVCEAPPEPVGAGDVIVTGLTSALTLHPETQYQYYAATFDPEPDDGDLFEAGAVITATAEGGNVPGFTLTSRGVASLETTLACPAPLTGGEALALSWTPSGQAGDRLRVVFQSGNHGTQFARIECDTADTGALVIDAALVSGYLAGQRPVESWRMTRVHESRGLAGDALVALSIESGVLCMW